MMNFSAVILAGGKSSRMGRDKALLEIGGRTLLSRQIHLARELGALEVFISARQDADYHEPGCVLVHDEFAGAGPLAGIERTLDASAWPLLLVLAVDLPAMNLELLRELAARCTATAGVIPSIGGSIEPLAAFYPKSAARIATAMLAEGRLAARDFATGCVQAGIATLVMLPPETAACFANWNSPGDLPGSAF